MVDSARVRERGGARGGAWRTGSGRGRAAARAGREATNQPHSQLGSGALWSSALDVSVLGHSDSLAYYFNRTLRAATAEEASSELSLVQVVAAVGHERARCWRARACILGVKEQLNAAPTARLIEIVAVIARAALLCRRASRVEGLQLIFSALPAQDP